MNRGAAGCPAMGLPIIPVRSHSAGHKRRKPTASLNSIGCQAIRAFCALSCDSNEIQIGLCSSGQDLSTAFGAELQGLWIGSRGKEERSLSYGGETAGSFAGVAPV